jgi:uncharacterized protein (TIGR02594 family)
MTEPRWVELARDYLGTAEIPGSRNNKDIVAMHQAVSGVAHDDSVPWCAAYVGTVLAKSAIKGSGSLMARSYSRWGDPVDEDNPPVGAIVVLSSSRGPASGHVGFCVGVDSAFVHLLGGNQGDKVSIAKFPKGKIVAARWPHGEPRGVVKTGGNAEVNPRDD